MTFLGGGFLPASMILLAGSPGTGKTILATQFLHHGASKLGEKGIYVSLAENDNDYFRNMLTLGMDMKSLENKKLFKFMSFPTMEEVGMKLVIDEMMNEISKFGAKRLVVDSISAILQILGPAETRKFLHVLFGRIVKSMGVTAIIVGEIPMNESKTGFGVEEFVADGVVLLRTIKTGNVEKRQIEIAKMRGTPIDRSTFEYLIDKDYGGIGLIVLPTKASIEISTRERLTSGVEGLDKMLNGGVFRHSITLIEGSSGIGKTILTLQFLYANALKGEKALFLSLEEPVGQIRGMLEGFGMDYKVLGDKFQIDLYVPEALTPLHYYKAMREILVKLKPTILAMDSISAMQHNLPQADFNQFMRYLQLLCKEKNLTVFLTSGIGTLEAATSSGVSTLADNIIVMRYYELKDRLAREMLVVKTRGSPHDKRVTTFDTTGKGIVINI